MTERALAWAGVVIWLAWGIAAGGLVTGTWGRVEDAAAIREARDVAETWLTDSSARRASVRPLIAAGRIASVVKQMERFVGPEAARLATDDRALVLRDWARRYVSVPIKDADQWDIIGAVVLEARPWRGLALPLGVVMLAVVLGVVVTREGVERSWAAESPGRSTVPLTGLALLAVGLAAIVVLTRLHLEQATRAFPPLTAQARFDPLWYAPPTATLSALALLGVTLAAAVALSAVCWLAQGARSMTARRETLAAWLFLTPSAAHLALFTAVPLGFTLYLALHQWDLLALEHPFVGLRNFRELAGDPVFWNALKNTAIYSLYVPVSLACALGAALVLNQPLRGVRVLRAVVFLPTVVSYVAVAMVWQWMYNADYGILNYLARSLGLPGVDWLGNPASALGAVMVVSVWVQVGYQMVVYVAGLQGIPRHLYEAAALDGAGTWERFWRITLPLLRPVSLYLLITGFVWSFQVFTLVYVMTEGGPLRSTDVLVYHIYQQAFEFRRMGLAAAQSWVLFAILLGLTALQWRALNRRVEYAA
jgi:multiple sugar transport system permease protein